MTNIGTSAQFNKEVNQAYNEIPRGVRKTLDGGGFSILTVNKLGEAFPEKKGERQTGYPEGSTVDSVTGYYDPKYNIATIPEHPDLDRLGDAKGLVKHEVGHAFDKSLKDYSQSDEYKGAFNRDIAKMSEEQKEKVQYYIQAQDKNGSGQFESFAEIFCQQVGCNDDPEQLEKYFPETTALVKKKIREAQQ